MEQFPTVPRYVIDARIGQGGMAVVYRAYHAELGTRHAIKVLSPAFQYIRDRIVQEGRIQAALDHPNILAVTDVVDVAGAPGLVMPLVEGPSLHDLMTSGRRMNPADIDAIARGVLAGVAEAHRHGIVHRDLKPANVLVRQTPGGFIPKVADFGLAKVLAGDASGGGMGLSRTGAPIGTPAYMAPEQVRNGKDVDHRADIFAIGVMLYEMLSNKSLFERVDVLETMKAVTDGSRRPIREAVPDVTLAIELAIERALDIDRDRRWQSCDAMLAAWEGRSPLKEPPRPPPTLLTPAQTTTPPSDLSHGISLPPFAPSQAPQPSGASASEVSLSPFNPVASRAPMLAAGGLLLFGGFGVAGIAAVGLASALGLWHPDPIPQAAASTEPVVEAPIVALSPPVVEAMPAVEEKPRPLRAMVPPSVTVTEKPPVVVDVPATTPRVVAAEPDPVPFVINTRPPSQSMTVDGKSIGKSPFQGTLTPGRHRVVFSTGDGQTYKGEVVVEAGVHYCYDFETNADCGGE
jgi:serine/threonine protein kinase